MRSHSRRRWPHLRGADAQTTYYVRDLGPVSSVTPVVLRIMQFDVPHNVHLPFRINSKGQVASYRSVTVDQPPPLQPLFEFEPQLWLPEYDAAIDQGPALINLSSPAGFDPYGIALDINESTQIAGASGTVQGGDLFAAVWTFDANNDLVQTSLDFSSSVFEDDRWSHAHGINDESPPNIVGRAQFKDTQECGSPPDPTFNPQAFIAELGSTPVKLPIDFDPNVDFHWSRALSVNSATSPESVGDVFDDCEDTGPEDIAVFPVHWDGNDGLIARPDPNYGSQALKINEAGNIVGWGREVIQAEPLETAVIASYWEDGASSPVELGNFDAFDDFEQSIAFGANETSPLMVVGASITAAHAYAWLQATNGQWDSSDTSLVIDLNDVLFGDCGGENGEWVLREAFDVNDDGWIVGWGLRNGQPRAFVLVPTSQWTTCMADLSECPDGNVDVFDLLILIANWGTSGTGAGLSSDGGGAGVVDVFDLLELLKAWGVCGQTTGQVPETAQDCYDKFHSDPEALEQCLFAIELD